MNIREKRKEKIKKLKLTTAIIAISVIAILIFAVVFNLNKKNNTLDVASQEHLRAMTYERVQTGDEVVENTSGCVNFNAFFLRDLDGDGYAEKIKGTCKEVGTSDALYFSLSVLTEGTLKNGKIEILETNSYFQTTLIEDETIKENYISVNTPKIELKDVNVGTQKLIYGNIRSGNYSIANEKTTAIKSVNDYTGKVTVRLTGTYRDNEGIETEIEKEIELDVDWYGRLNTEIPSVYGENKTQVKNQDYNIMSAIKSESNELDLKFMIVSQETEKDLAISKAYIEGIMPELGGYGPTEVIITGGNVQYTYDQATRKYSAYREAIVSEEGKVLSQAYSGSYGNNRYTEFNVEVKYPLEAYEALGTSRIDLNVPVTAYYEGYTNPNNEFNYEGLEAGITRSKSKQDIVTATYRSEGGDIIGINVKLGTYVQNIYKHYVISKSTPTFMYNNEILEKPYDIYETRWSVIRGNDGKIDSMKLKAETPDQFLDNTGNYIDMDEVTENIGIYFTGASSLLGSNGYIEVYNDDTNELIHRFTKADWNSYGEDNPYMYEEGIKNIRIETGEALANRMMTVTNVKKLDANKILEKYTYEEFSKYLRIYSHFDLESHLEGAQNNTKITTTEFAYYEDTISTAVIKSITPNYISTQEATDVEVTIATQSLNYNSIDWINGEFLLKLPQDVLIAKINNIEIQNTNVKVLGYDIYKNEEDKCYYVKIMTENENPEEYTVKVNLSLTPDPRKLTATKKIELYSYNANYNNYNEKYKTKDIYDINSNGNKEEYVGYYTETINLVGPTSILTTETAKNFDDVGNVIDTAIAPQVVTIDKTDNNRTAEVSVQIINNYTGSVSEVKVIGKIPFAGNTFQILQERELGSTFTTRMTGPITLPEVLQNVATVYYSYNEQVNEDLTDTENNWMTENEVTDWTRVRTYAIDLEEYVLTKGEELICTYEIYLPVNIGYNEVSYATHAVYFYLETEEGKLKDQTETNKLGFMIAKKFNLEVEKLRIDRQEVLEGATYKLIEEETGEARMLTTGADGKFVIPNLYVERNYILQEIKAPKSYMKNEEEIKFTTYVDAGGNLVLDLKEGTIKRSEIKTAGVDTLTLKMELEDIPKVNIEIRSIDEDTKEPIRGAKYEITGEGLPERGVIITTNEEGKAVIGNLIEGKTYRVREIKNTGYYVSDQIAEIIIERTNNVYTDTIVKSEITGNEETLNITNDSIEDLALTIPKLKITIEKEKVPTYSMQIIKYKKGTEEVLEGAKFRITGAGKEDGEEYTTDENGILDINNLYEKVEGKNIDPIYEIEEILPPQGYSLNSNKTRFSASRDNENNLNITVEAKEENEEDLYTEVEVINANQEDAKVKFKVEDETLFKLYKKDGETGEALPNTKFAIYEVDEEGNEHIACNTKDEPVGRKETRDGKEYYILETDENGEINADLREGLYKIVEVEGVEGYYLDENEENRTYYFGIGRTADKVSEWIEKIEFTRYQEENSYNFNDCATSQDGGYVAVGYFEAHDLIILGSETVSGNDIKLHNNGQSDILIVKYNSLGQVEWCKTIGGEGGESLEKVIICSDGGIIAVGNFFSNSIIINGNETVSGNDITLNRQGDEDGIVIKYNSNGKIEWLKDICGNKFNALYGVVQSLDEGFVVVGSFNSSFLTIGENETVSGENVILTNKGSWDGLIIKYNQNGKVEWARNIGGNKEEYLYDITIDENGYYCTCGHFASQTVIIEGEETVGVNDIILSSNGGSDELIIRYDSNGYIESAKNIGGTSRDSLNKIVSTNDGGYVAVGESYSNSITIGGEETADGNNILLTNTNGDGIIVKYNSEMKIEWIKNIGETGYTYLESVDSTIDGGSICVGYFYNTNIIIQGEDTADGNKIEVHNNGSYDFLMIKYNAQGKAEWATGIGGNGSEHLYGISTNNDGSYVAVGNFDSQLITVEGKDTVSQENIDIMISSEKTYGIMCGIAIKCNSEGKVNFSKSHYNASHKQIEFDRLLGTPDGGLISGGILIGSYTFLSEETESGEEINLISNGLNDYLVIKYNSEGKIEWGSCLGGINNEYLNGIALSNDGGYIIVGHFFSETITIEGTKTVTGNDIILTNNDTSYNGIIVKYNAEGKVEWAKGFGGSRQVSYSEVMLNKSDNYMVLGSFSNNNIIIDGKDTESGNSILLNGNSNRVNGLLIEYNSEGKIVFASSIAGMSLHEINETNDGGYIAVGSFNDSTISITGEYTVSGNNIILISNGNYDCSFIKYNSEGKVEWAKNIGGDDYECYEASVRCQDGGIISTMYFESSQIIIDSNDTVDGNEIIINNKGSYDCIIIKYNEYGKIEWAKNNILKNASDYFETRAITECKDGGYAIAGYFTSTTIIDAEDTVDNTEIVLSNIGNNEGFLIKYNNYGKVEWAKVLSDTSNLADLIQLQNEEYLVAGFHFSESLLYKTYEKITLPEIASKQELTVENTKLNYNITTEVIKNSSNTYGGTISGIYNEEYQEKDHIKYIENVKYGEDAINNIVITPDEGYRVLKVKVNDEEIHFDENADGTVILETLKNVTTNKHITVEFSNIVTNVVVHHYLKDTTEKIAPDEIIYGNIGEKYEANPLMDLEEYDLQKDQDNKYIVPANARGEFTNEIINVNYYYELRKYNYKIEYYFDGILDENITRIQNAEINSEISNINIPEKGEWVYKNITGLPLTITSNEEDNTIRIYYESSKILNSTISITAIPEEINDVKESINYEIKYKANLENGKGEASLKIEAKFDNAIDISKSNIQGGIYNETAKTITWNLKVTEDENIIEIAKNIDIVYKDLNPSKESLEVQATGNLKLSNNNESNVEDKAKVKANYVETKTVKVEFIGEEKENWPEITVKLIGNETEIETITLSSQNDWEYSIENLPKYSAEGERINYTFEQVIPEGYGFISKEEEEGTTTIVDAKLGKIELILKDAKDDEILENAEFTIRKLKEENGNWVIDEEFTPKVLITDENGQIIFDGLEYGRYEIKETKAPEGYELMSAKVTVDIDETNVEVEEIVYNVQHAKLPATGSVAGGLIIMIGIAIIISGGYILIAGKRKNEEKK